MLEHIVTGIPKIIPSPTCFFTITVILTFTLFSRCRFGTPAATEAELISHWPFQVKEFIARLVACNMYRRGRSDS
jgi:hypothetical protein